MIEHYFEVKRGELLKQQLDLTVTQAQAALSPMHHQRPEAMIGSNLQVTPLQEEEYFRIAETSVVIGTIDHRLHNDRAFFFFVGIQYTVQHHAGSRNFPDPRAKLADWRAGR